MSEHRIISNGGTPIWIQPRHHNNGVIVSQGKSYLVIGNDEIEQLVQAMKEITNS